MPYFFEAGSLPELGAHTLASLVARLASPGELPVSASIVLGLDLNSGLYVVQWLPLSAEQYLPQVSRFGHALSQLTLSVYIEWSISYLLLCNRPSHCGDSKH